MPSVRAIAVTALAVGLVIGCRSHPNPGLIVTVVNSSSARAAIEWRDDAPFARANSDPIEPCELTARGIKIGVRSEISILSGNQKVSFTVEPTAYSGSTPERTVVIRADGSIDPDAPPWPLGHNAC